YSSSKLIVRRNLLISDWDDFNYSTLDDYIFVSIKFDKSDFVISPDHQFNFFSTNAVFYKDIKPTLVDSNSNEVRFQFESDFFNKNLKATITKPVILQFAEVNY
ncbi:MAG: hypothetical protein J7L15_01975, partial [Clostridiales bacterium]|nr:hypothetical protein [Clostridiales bacterium]